MNRWTAYPFLRITIVWIFGIIAGTYSSMDGNFEVTVLLVFFALCILLHLILPKAHFYKLNTLYGGILLFLLFFAGAFHSSRYDHSKNKDNIVQFDSIEWYSGIVSEGVQETEKFLKTRLQIGKVKTKGQWRQASGEILFYYPKDLMLSYGDELLVQGGPDEITPPSNPYEFDYRQFLARQNIFHQHFIRDKDQVLIVGHNKGSAFYSMVLRVRGHATKLIKTHMQGKHEQAVALALIMGVKDELDNELKSAYGIAGAMHVLAVSGLHVGIVYGFLLMIFGNIRRGRYGRLIFALINLSALWTYALLTGFAPSTLRATIMFSAIILSQTFNRQTSIYNSIFFSAFIILLYNPFMIFAIGFQLSFLAVLGIVYLTLKIYRFVDVDHWLLDKIWMLMCVSLAAQIATFPITVLYFNQVPVYFWAVNLVVIPAAFVILISGITFLAVGSWEWLGAILGKVVELVILGMNKVVFVVEKIPGSVLYPLKISASQALLLYLFMFALLAFLYFKKFKYIVIGSVCLSIFVFFDAAESFRDSNQQKIMFYYIPGHTAIDFVEGKKSYLYATPELISSKDQLKFSILPFHLEHNLSCNLLNTLPLAISDSNENFDIMVFKGKKIVYIKEQLNYLDLENKICADFLIIGNNSIRDLNALLRNFDPGQIIIDGANSRWLASRLYQQSRELNLNCVSLLDQGGHLIKL